MSRRAASTARRRGAAVNVVRISPVLYSALNASTPMTLTAITGGGAFTRGRWIRVAEGISPQAGQPVRRRGVRHREIPQAGQLNLSLGIQRGRSR